jgi:hypothetical protein
MVSSLLRDKNRKKTKSEGPSAISSQPERYPVSPDGEDDLTVKATSTKKKWEGIRPQAYPNKK